MMNDSGRISRTTRLLKLQMLLCQFPDGIKVEKLAEKCGTSKRTVYRDLTTLESELGVPVWEYGSKRGLESGYYLPPIVFTLKEAMSIFLAARLVQNFSHNYNPDIFSAFLKLNTVVPQPLRKQIMNTLECMDLQPKDETKLKNFDKLVDAWLSQHKVKILYQTLTGNEPSEYIVDPYFIEPTVLNRSSCMIAYCDLKKSILIFKLDNIARDVIVEPDTFQIPSDFNAMDYVSSEWDIYVFDQLETVKLRFNQRISDAVLLTRWHPSQLIQKQNDGSIIMTVKVRNSIHFRSWVLMWGNEVEILEPEILRHQIGKVAQSLVEIYSYRKQTSEVLNIL